MSWVEMGLCWSEPPPPPIVQSRPPMYIVDKSQPQPSAPPYQAPQYPPVGYQNPNYTYAVQYPQQQMVYQQPIAYISTPYQYPPQQRQMGTGTAMLGGFVLGAVAEDILDPTE